MITALLLAGNPKNAFADYANNFNDTLNTLLLLNAISNSNRYNSSNSNSVSNSNNYNESEYNSSSINLTNTSTTPITPADLHKYIESKSKLNEARAAYLNAKCEEALKNTLNVQEQKKEEKEEEKENVTVNVWSAAIIIISFVALCVVIHNNK
jgi:ATP-dependent Zn protease